MALLGLFISTDITTAAQAPPPSSKDLLDALGMLETDPQGKHVTHTHAIDTPRTINVQGEPVICDFAIDQITVKPNANPPTLRFKVIFKSRSNETTWKEHAKLVNVSLHDARHGILEDRSKVVDEEGARGPREWVALGKTWTPTGKKDLGITATHDTNNQVWFGLLLGTKGTAYETWHVDRTLIRMEEKKNSDKMPNGGHIWDGHYRRGREFEGDTHTLEKDTIQKEKKTPIPTLTPLHTTWLPLEFAHPDFQIPLIAATLLAEESSAAAHEKESTPEPTTPDEAEDEAPERPEDSRGGVPARPRDGGPHQMCTNPQQHSK